MRRALLLLGLLVFSPAAAAEDNPACAKFEDPLAYNACLARQGPMARAAHVRTGPTRGAPASRAPARRAGGRIVTTGGRKRGEMVFTVGK
jgi:hypothetical protein